MTDDLARRLRGPQSAEVDYATRQEGADRIETLTAQLESTLKDRAAIIAERDRAFRLRDMAADASSAFLDKLAVLEADNARLREALEDIADHDTGATAGLAYTAKIALKGETP